MKKMKKLTELFDTPVEWKYVSGSSDYDLYSFDIISENQKLKYFVTFSLSSFKEDSREEFRYTDYEFLYDNDVIDEFPVDVAEVNFSKAGKDKYGITGTGHQFTVFATVLEILKSWEVDNSNIDIIMFSAKEKSRQRLYRTFSKNISKELRDFYFHDEYDLFEDLVFVFKRK